MKRLSKILSAVLLLAIALSAFGVFSVFASDETALAPKVIYDMDSKESLAFINKTTTAEGLTSPNVSKKTDASGTYWLIETNVKTGETIGNGSGAYIQMSPTSTVVLKDHDTKGKKNTDFMVIDLDVATDSEFIEYLQFHMRYANNTLSDKNPNGATSQDGNGYPQIYGNSYETLRAAQKTNFTGYPVTELENTWVNVSFVYDFRGQEQSGWKCYAYIDGYYVGTLKSATKADSYWYQWLRLSVPAKASSDYQSTKVRNLTYTAYPVGWNGDLADGLLGKLGVNAADINDLAYTLEGANAKPNALLATVKRGDELISIYDFSNLDANFADGDVVTLYRDVATPLLVNAKDVTILDNGFDYTLVDTTAITDWSAVKYVVLDYMTRAIKSSGDATAFASLGLTNGTVVVLLDDLSYTASGVAMYSKKVVFDLNGHQMNLASTKRMFNSQYDGNGVLRFVNGKLVFEGAYQDITMMSGNNAFVFQDLELQLDKKTFIDQRNGLVLLRNATVNVPNSGTDKAPAYALLTSLKGNCNCYSALQIIDSEIITGGNIANISNTSSSSKRQGGLNAMVKVINSDINTGGAIPITVNAYGNQTGLSLDDEGNFVSSYNNDFNVDISIVDSKITTNSRLVDAALSQLRYTDKTYGVYDANGMTVDVNVDINNSEIKCTNVVRQHCNAAGSDEIDFSFDVNVDVDYTSKLNASAGVAFINTANEKVNMTVNLAEGVKLGTPELSAAAALKETVFNLGNGSVVAGSSLVEGYNAIVTSLYRECSYEVNNYNGTEVVASGKFLWNSTRDSGDKVDMNRYFTLPESTSEYVYTDWVASELDTVYTSTLKPNFKMAANLTALTDFHLNVYLPTSVDPANLVVSVNGTEITEFEIINIDGVDYYAADAAVIKGITPEAVSTAYPVAVTINGALDETMTINTTISVEKYLLSAFKTSTAAYNQAVADEDEAAIAKAQKSLNFIQTIINYVVAASRYNDNTAPEALQALATTISAPQYANVQWNGPAGVNAALNLGDSVRWVFTVENKEATYTISYAGVTRTFTPDEDGQIVIGIRAVDLLGDIVITDNSTGESGTVNLAGYHKNVDDIKAKIIVNALYHYSVAASAYAEIEAAE